MGNRISNKYNMKREDVIRRVASGQSLLQIEKSSSMPKNAIYQLVRRWGIQGITKEKALEMLGGMTS